MDNYSIKSVAFGGFDKKDVVRYIEQTSQQAAALQQELQSEIDTLRSSNAALSDEISALRAQLNEASERCIQMESALNQEVLARRELETLKPLEEEVSRLKAEAEVLRPNAEAYVRFRENLGNIECEARKRASDMESAALSQLQRTVDLFRSQYQIMMNTFEATASHVNTELRKVEVNLSQLPRTMDQAGNELNTLAAQLKQDH